MSTRLLSLASCEGEHLVFNLRSDALARVNIPQGSRLLACPATEASDGDLVIAKTPKGKLVRFFRERGQSAYLDARNPAVPPLILPMAAVKVLGVVCTILT